MYEERGVVSSHLMPKEEYGLLDWDRFDWPIKLIFYFDFDLNKVS